MRRFPLVIIGLLFHLSLLPAVWAQVREGPAQLCRNKLAGELSKVHDEFRSYIFGSRLDAEGTFTVLTGGHADAERKGIFETQGRLTSELVPPLVESYRALRCRSYTICAVLRESVGVKGGEVTVRPLGCAEQTVPRYAECYLAEPQSTFTASQNDEDDLRKYCGQMVEDSLQFERRALQLAVAYDSGYRASAQIAGMIDWVQVEFPGYVLKPLRDMVGLLGKLYEIPCFIGQCDYPDTSGIAP